MSNEPADDRLDRVEREFRDLVEDVRQRVVQVKREADAKAPADHDHDDLERRLERVATALEALDDELEGVDRRVDRGFENYEEVLEYLTETTDEVQRRLARLASVVLELREQLRDATRDEVRRTALAHLTDAANRHGVDRARCEACEATVDLSLLVAPRCPHCDAAFTTLEPRRGFFRTSVLHTGRLPALESPPEAAVEADALEDLAGAPVERDEAPLEALADEEPPVANAAAAGESAAAADAAGAAATGPDDAGGEAEAADGGAVAAPAVDADLQDLEGVGPAYADRLREAGVDDVAALAVADPASLASAVELPEATVRDWVDQAEALVEAA